MRAKNQKWEKGYIITDMTEITKYKITPFYGNEVEIAIIFP